MDPFVRASRDDTLMDVAYAISKRGTCSRLQVGAVFSKDGRIISTGYNGAVKGQAHCDHSQDGRPMGWVVPDGVEQWNVPIEGRIMVVQDSDFRVTPLPAEGGCQIAEHAERNAIAYAARFGVALDGSELHVTHAPCLACSRTVVNAGIVKVSYDIPYRLTAGVELLAAAGIEVVYRA